MAASRSLGQYKPGPGLPRDGSCDGRKPEAPPATPPTRRGFGSLLIESLLAAELNGTVKITYGPKDVVCEVDANLLRRMGSAAKISLSWKPGVHFLP